MMIVYSSRARRVCKGVAKNVLSHFNQIILLAVAPVRTTSKCFDISQSVLSEAVKLTQDFSQL